MIGEIALRDGGSAWVDGKRIGETNFLNTVS